MSDADFFSDWWEQQPLHVSRADRGHFATLVSPAEIEQLLSTADLHFPAVQLARANNPVAPADYTSHNKRIAPLRMLQCHREGATIIIAEAHRHFVALAGFCRSIQQAWRMRIHANLYLTPAGAQGFKSHYDTHDVFITQVSGSKRFRFYPSTIELPFIGDDYDPEHNPVSDIIEEIVLQAGDTLYIPRGVVHDAVANGQQSSLHLTLGVYPALISDLLQEMVRVAAEQDAGLRRSVLLRDIEPDDIDAMLPSVVDILQKLNSTDVLNDALSRLSEEQDTASSYDCIGMLAPVDENKFHLNATLVLRQATDLQVTREGDKVTLRGNAQLLELNDPLGAAIEYLCQHKTVIVDDLPGLNVEQKEAFCRVLLDANICRM